MDQYHIDIDPLETIENMSVSNQQFVKILKALMNRSRILIMDEPTSMFNVEDAGKVLDLVRAMSERGISIIYISHFLKEVVKIADRITVIRDGSVIRTYDNSAKGCSLNDITSDMVGAPGGHVLPARALPHRGAGAGGEGFKTHPGIPLGQLPGAQGRNSGHVRHGRLRPHRDRPGDFGRRPASRRGCADQRGRN